jgi:ABC-type dipeptide/oligopeptide/nickel transport system permease subunit
MTLLTRDRTQSLNSTDLRLAAPAVARPEAGEAPLIEKREFWKALRKNAKHYPVGFIAGFGLLFILLASLAAPLIVQHSPTEFLSAGPLQGPSAEAWLGTDQLGRDLMSRMLYGARTSFLIAGSATLAGVAVGATLGLVSGYFGGKVDMLLQRGLDVFDAFPALVLAILLVSLAGASAVNVALAIAVVLIPGVNRVVRSVTLGIRGLEYIEAARSLGASHWRIMYRHIAPGLSAPIMVLAAASLGGSIIAEASLSFLGLGAPPPTPTLGQMLSSEVRQYFITMPWLAIVPGVFLASILLFSSLLGDTLRDVFDPRLRQR